MVRKCNRGIADIAVMEVAQVGVRTRARAALAVAATRSSGTAKRKKVNTGELVKFSSSYVQLKSRRRVEIASDNLVIPATAESNIERTTTTTTTEEEQCSSPSSDHVQDGSAEVETSTYNSCRERREMTPSSELRAESDNVESTVRPSVADSRSRSAVAKMPTELELEEFFATAEKDIQKKFSEKYNYDIAKDVPLEGRYEWIRLKP
ncbi:cyclin-dependent kinase inhibitor 1 isoform X2 [Ziziphus jujuba]|uniref:Cyclin-dependent kinase inhibitor n=1 Tax=Ziziphus jujuba TaxID=326968 RepID=A0A6P4A4F2_ZIZJJ|nr:cyclin-dependent kinase inhibitor 1 isoform X2 [Ziziphus jujuba]